MLEIEYTVVDTESIKYSLPLDALILNDLIIDSMVDWQVHNCKITKNEITQDHPLPFLYHYDRLSEEIKSSHPLTPELLTQFNIPMSAAAANRLLRLPKETIATPWQVKIIGTLVMYSQALQIALRLRFTNTAKPRTPIYTNDKESAMVAAMRHWHFFGEVFVLNQQTKPLFAVSDIQASSDQTSDVQTSDIQTPNSKGTDFQNTNLQHSNSQSNASLSHSLVHSRNDSLIPEPYLISQGKDYQQLPEIYAITILTALDNHQDTLATLDDAIQTRIR